MPDCNVVLAQFASPDLAKQAAGDLRAAFRASLEYLREHCEVPLSAITPPLLEFAAREGFAWDKEDAFSWDEADPLEPSFEIAAADRILVAAHCAAYDIGERGVQAFARARRRSDGPPGARSQTHRPDDPLHR